jgi:tetratricopeptide (TPR) repeat protein
VSDDISALSDALARDPASLAFLDLGEALRRRGQLEPAMKVALKGLERHPHLAEAHDLLARLFVDRGELDPAFDEWDMVARLSPAHPGALKGMGFVRFQQGRLSEAEQYLAAAAAVDPGDEQNRSALAYVQAERAAARLAGASDPSAAARASATSVPAPTPEPAAATAPAAAPTPARARTPEPDSEEPDEPESLDAARHVFHEAIGDQAGIALLIGHDGLVLAGETVTREGRDVAQEIGASMSGVGDEAQRAMRHLGLGGWSSVVFETDRAIVAMAPSRDESLVLVAAARTTPLGFVKRMLERSAAAASAFLAGG